MEEQHEYFETTEVHGGRPSDMITPPIPDGAGWELYERLTIGQLVVFRWRRVKQKEQAVRRAALR